MPFQIVHNDICKMNTDAIVNAANIRLKMGSGVCGAIFKEAGAEKLQKACDQIGYCSVGEAVITEGYGLKAKYVIHTVGPIWEGGGAKEAELLQKAYTSTLNLAKEKGIGSIALPLIAAGIYGYPKEQALNIAIQAIKMFLQAEEMTIYLVLFDRSVVELSEGLYKSITHYIDHYYEDEKDALYLQRHVEERLDLEEYGINVSCESPSEIPLKRTLEDLFQHMDETFSEMLLRLIDEKGHTDVNTYKKANIDRKLFSKIRSNKHYIPKKTTILALAIALELSLDETQDLLMKAGYALNMSHKADVIIQYFIENQHYDLFEINETLFYFVQPLLGSV